MNCSRRSLLIAGGVLCTNLDALLKAQTRSSPPSSAGQRRSVLCLQGLIVPFAHGLPDYKAASLFPLAILDGYPLLGVRHFVAIHDALCQVVDGVAPIYSSTTPGNAPVPASEASFEFRLRTTSWGPLNSSTDLEAAVAAEARTFTALKSKDIGALFAQRQLLRQMKEEAKLHAPTGMQQVKTVVRPILRLDAPNRRFWHSSHSDLRNPSTVGVYLERQLPPLFSFHLSSLSANTEDALLGGLHSLHNYYCSSEMTDEALFGSCVA